MYLMNRSIVQSFAAVASQSQGFTALIVPLLLLCSPAHAQQQITSRVPIAFNRFYSSEELNDMVRKLATAYPSLLSIEQIGSSVQGRPLLVATLNNSQTGIDTSKPAMWIDGNIHGNEIQASEVVLYSLWYLTSGYDQVPDVKALVDRCAFYFMVSVNPDGRDGWFRGPSSSHSSRTGQAPIDDDRDGVCDEDGPDDLDGDGSVGMMWRRDPNGTHRRKVDDPRIFEYVAREVLPDGTVRHGDWSMAGSEGIDNDADGRSNEDGLGGYDMNRNWPSDWQPEFVQDGAGKWPLCWPETQAIAQFILRHPNIAAVQSYHNAGGMILRGPGHPSREGEYPAADKTTYQTIQTAGVEMLPFYRSMVIHSDLYPVRGGFVNWTAEGLGIISLTNELWTEQRILQSGQAPDEAADMRWTDRMLLGQTFSDWKEVPHPDYGTVLVGGGDKWSSRIPPPFMLEEESHRNFAFTTYHAQCMPLLRMAPAAVKALPDGLWQIDVEVFNDRPISSRTARAAQKRIGQPDRLELLGTGVQVVSAGELDDRTDRTMEAVRYRPARLLLQSGIPGLSSRLFRFIVQGQAGTKATVTYTAEKAVDLTQEVMLAENAAKP
ncbi:MAG: hypothetical protein EXS00_04230 [Phycisphaerales bacterium]|nr:hypothetical protein [Phycisphaerales bacterium]